MNYYIFIIAALLACFSSCHANTFNLENRIECLRTGQTKLGESTIKDLIEKFREILKVGMPALKIPPFDPLNVTDHRISVDNKFLRLNSTWTALSNGAAGFEITKLSLSLIGLNLKLILTWPDFLIAGNYDISTNSSVLSHNISGNGLFNLDTKNFVFGLDAKLSLKLINGKLTPQFKKVELALSVEEFLLKITGIMGDEVLSEKISSYLSENFPKLLTANQTLINKIIADNLSLINKIIAGNKMFSENDRAILTTLIINCGGYEF